MIVPTTYTFGLILAGTIAVAPGTAAIAMEQGDVAIIRGDTGERVAARMQASLRPGDALVTGDGSRAEVRFEGASVLRLEADSQVRFVTLDGALELQLASGTAEFEQSRPGDGSAHIDTPSATVRPDRAGDYRISVSPDGETKVGMVRAGP